jgi:hypothetical protein
MYCTFVSMTIKFYHPILELFSFSFTPFSIPHQNFQEAFSQSDFQKGPKLNKQIYKEDMHILHNYEKYLKIIRGKVQRLLIKFLLNVEILQESFIFMSKLFQSFPNSLPDELGLYDSSNFALHYINTKFLSKHCIKGYLAQRWMVVTVSIFLKNFLTKCRS